MRFLLILIFSTQLLSAPAFAAVVVSESVGQVAETVITSREVQIAAVIDQVLYPVKGSAGIRELKVESSEFRQQVANVLLEAVVSIEAENFNVGTVSEDDLVVAINKVGRATAGNAYWNRLEVTDAELSRVTSRKLVAKAFLKFKSNSMLGMITDQEAQAYYEKNRVKFGSMPFANFRDNIKSFLAQQQLEERLRSWFEIIKRKYKVRNLLPVD